MSTTDLLEMLILASEENPDLRLGQLLVNVVGVTCPEIFYISDQRLCSRLRTVVVTGKFEWEE